MGRRKKKKSNQETAKVPMDSMIDVVFLLLIYFIVTQKPIIEETLLGVNLPSSQKAAPKENQEEPPPMVQVDVVKLQGNNTNILYHINNEGPYTLTQIRTEIFPGLDKESTLIINCGPNAPHSKLINILDAIAETDIKKINIVNDERVRFVEQPITVVE